MSEYPSFSVAMSVYKNDKAEYVERALQSITKEQTVKPNEIIVVVDGPVPSVFYSLPGNGKFFH